MLCSFAGVAYTVLYLYYGYVSGFIIMVQKYIEACAFVLFDGLLNNLLSFLYCMRVLIGWLVPEVNYLITRSRIIIDVWKCFLRDNCKSWLYVLTDIKIAKNCMWFPPVRGRPSATIEQWFAKLEDQANEYSCSICVMYLWSHFLLLLWWCGWSSTVLYKLYI